MAWLHIQDFEIDLAYDLGQMRRGRSFVEKIESSLMKRFNGVSAISAQMLEKARIKGAAENRLSLSKLR